MKSDKNPIIILLLTLTFTACSDEPTTAPVSYNRLEAINITDKIVLSSSEIISADSIAVDVYSINFGNSNTFIEGKILDVSIMYVTASSCDEDVFILNNKTLQWDQIGFRPDVYTCFAVLTEHRHLLSTNNFLAENFIDSEGKVLMKYSGPNYGIGGRIFEVAPDYFESTIPIGKFGISTAKIDFVDDSFWIFNDRENVFRNKSLDGTINYSVTPPSEQVSAFSADEQRIWYIDPAGSVFGIDNTTGEKKCRFTTTAVFPSGLTIVGSNIWTSFFSSSKSRLHSYDLSKSCESGVGVPLKNIEFSNKRIKGLDWDGSNLLLLDDKLNVVDISGSLITAYTLEVHESYQVVWDGEAVMLFHRGPVPRASSKGIITRFLLN